MLSFICGKTHGRNSVTISEASRSQAEGPVLWRWPRSARSGDCFILSYEILVPIFDVLTSSSVKRSQIFSLRRQTTLHSQPREVKTSTLTVLAAQLVSLTMATPPGRHSSIRMKAPWLPL